MLDHHFPMPLVFQTKNPPAMGSARRLRHLWALGALALPLLNLSWTKQRLFSALLEVKEVRGTHDEQHGSTVEPSGVEVNIMNIRRYDISTIDIHKSHFCYGGIHYKWPCSLINYCN